MKLATSMFKLVVLTSLAVVGAAHADAIAQPVIDDTVTFVGTGLAGSLAAVGLAKFGPAGTMYVYGQIRSMFRR